MNLQQRSNSFLIRTLLVCFIIGAAGCSGTDTASDDSTNSIISIPANDNDDSGPDAGDDNPGDTSTTVPEAPFVSEPIYDYSSGSESNSYYVTAKNVTEEPKMYVRVFYPGENADTEYLPAILLVPGGRGYSKLFTEKDVAQEAATANGIIYVVYDPAGRGDSTGTEDNGGSMHQDGLLAVFEFVRNELTAVDPDQVGFGTNSYGVTIASGLLARHPETAARFLIDFEGPANRDDTAGCAKGTGTGHLASVASCDDEVFWSEREASTFISQIHVPYQRIQTVTDHVQPDFEHAILLNNNAVNGASPWVRFNDGVEGALYDSAVAAPPLAANSIDNTYIISPMGDYAWEILAGGY